MLCPMCGKDEQARVVKDKGEESGNKVWFCHTECPNCGNAYDKWTEERKEIEYV